MKNVFLNILLFANLGFAQNSSLKIHSCETKNLYVLKGNDFHFESMWTMIKPQDTVISATDLEKINHLIEKLLEKPNDEALVNSCSLDGVNLKVFIENGKVRKRIFLGSYFEKNFNEIALILNSYIKKIESGFIVNVQIPYGTTNKKEIEEEIELQSKCNEMSEENKKSLLYNWCEPKE